MQFADANAPSHSGDCRHGVTAQRIGLVSAAAAALPCSTACNIGHGPMASNFQSLAVGPWRVLEGPVWNRDSQGASEQCAQCAGPRQFEGPIASMGCSDSVLKVLESLTAGQLLLRANVNS